MPPFIFRCPNTGFHVRGLAPGSSERHPRFHMHFTPTSGSGSLRTLSDYNSGSRRRARAPVRNIARDLTNLPSHAGSDVPHRLCSFVASMRNELCNGVLEVIEIVSQRLQIRSHRIHRIGRGVANGVFATRNRLRNGGTQFASRGFVELTAGSGNVLFHCSVPAMLALPREEYDWFDIQARAHREGGAGKPNENGTMAASEPDAAVPGVVEPVSGDAQQLQFFDYAGPLYSVVISPAASTTPLNEVRKFRALPRDRSRRRVQDDLQFNWEILEGDGALQGVADQEVEYRAPAIPGLTRLRVTVTQREIACNAEALVTVTDSLETAMSPAVVTMRGLPGYTFERAAGELWRCRFDAGRNIIVVNSGHRDFVFATRNRALQLRYLVRLYVKELVLKNFAGLPADQLLERVIELSLYTEEKLKSG